jgi:acyl-CoA thioester hydrolase
MEDGTIIKTIYYHDTDCGGVVYYANYLKYFEEGRTALLASKGVDLKKMADEGFLFVVSEVSLKYRKPIYYQDQIEVKTKIDSLRRSVIAFKQEIFREGQIMARGCVNVVCIGAHFKPVTLPEIIRKEFDAA